MMCILSSAINSNVCLKFFTLALMTTGPPDIAQYHLNSPNYTAHKSTSAFYGKKHGKQIYISQEALNAQTLDKYQF